MRILIISDTHGYTDNVIDYVESNKKPDMIFHLGDYVRDGVKIGNIFDIPIKIVRGNGDYMEEDFNYDEIVKIKDKKILLTHGHKYNISYSIDRLFYRGKELGVDYILFGHTHVPSINKLDDIIFMNPGSPHFPRTRDKRKTLGIIDIGDTVEEKIIEIK
ncbi:MAG TPA: metallophosphoesterase [Tissierellaceae bacterium]|nr:metallophosphoesterase [Tissierellaceae bacterium]